MFGQGEIHEIHVQMLLSGFIALALIGAMMFVPAGTFNYWQAWLVLAVTVISSWIMSIYFLRTNPAVLQRRQVTLESRSVQKALIGVAFVFFAAMVVLSALDHRFGWSHVPNRHLLDWRASASQSRLVAQHWCSRRTATPR